MLYKNDLRNNWNKVDKTKQEKKITFVLPDDKKNKEVIIFVCNLLGMYVKYLVEIKYNKKHNKIQLKRKIEEKKFIIIVSILSKK